MVPYLPNQITQRAIITYLTALLAVSLLFSSYSMKIGYMLLGVAFVVGFFTITSAWSKNGRAVSEKDYIIRIFIVAVFLRLIWVIASYYYYVDATGVPFEFDTADAISYHEGAVWISERSWPEVFKHYFVESPDEFADTGYPLYLTILYKIFGSSIILARIIKAFISALTCVLVYKLAFRTFGEQVARMAGIMMVFMPNLIIYCGYHLKETEMIFLEVAFLERMDYLLRNKKVSFWNIFLPTILAMSLFLFRTVLGAAAIFSFATAVILSNTPSMKRGWKRTALIGWGILCLVVLSGGTLMTEIEGYWEKREENVQNARLEQTLRGNQWAKYATGTVMAPMAFVLPFATMVDVDQQYEQQAKHGGNFIRNFMGFFALLAIFEALRQKKWRDFALIGSFIIAYLGVVSLSGFSNSERFLLPGLPCLILMWAYGISVLREKTFKLLTPWCCFVFLMEIAWAYFKLGSRGLF